MLFALHPIHTESIAWITERKDVLFAFFGFLSIYFYIDYTREEKIKTYLLSFLFFCFSLMSKAMLVTLPFLFLLFDFSILPRKIYNKKIFYEKIPFILFVIFVCLITINAEKYGGSLKGLDAFPLSLRISNIIVSYVKYIKNILYPNNLFFLIPYPKKIEILHTFLSFLFLFASSIYLFILRKKHPYFFCGWFWFLGSFVPAIGILQIGGVAMADRLAYFPAIGIYIIFVFLLSNLKRFKLIFELIVFVIFSMLFSLSFVQASYWKNSATLFKHTTDIMPNNYTATYLLYDGYIKIGEYEKAIATIKRAIYMKKHKKHYKILIEIYKYQGKTKDAIWAYKEIIKLHVDNANVYIEAANYLEALKKYDNAILLLKTGLSKVSKPIPILKKIIYLYEKKNNKIAANNYKEILKTKLVL